MLIMHREERITNYKLGENMSKLKPCPFCGKQIDENKELYLPERDWKPSFYDPDSGGDPISIVCKCGLEFSTGTYEWEEFVKAWNTRQ